MNELGLYVILFFALLLGTFSGIWLTLLMLNRNKERGQFKKAKERIAQPEEAEEELEPEKENLTGDGAAIFKEKVRKDNGPSVRELNCIMEGIDPDKHIEERQKKEDDSYRALKREK